MILAAAILAAVVILSALLVTPFDCLPVAKSAIDDDQALAYLRKFRYLADSGSAAATASDVANALARFQALYQLPITRLIDADTLRAMRQGRCGIGDSPDALDLDEQRLGSSIRARRSSSNISSLRQSEQQRRRKFRSQQVTWRITAPSQWLELSVQRDLLAKAFRLWSEVTPLTFTELVTPWGKPDIEVGFYTQSSHRCSHPFDGPGGETSHARAADWIHIDDDEIFEVAGGGVGTAQQRQQQTGVPIWQSARPDLLRVLVHEIGHTLGLSHSEDRGSVMHPAGVLAVRGGGVGVGSGDMPIIGRKEIEDVRTAYGHCKVSIDAMVDWPPGDGSRIISGDTVWQYDTVRGLRTRGPDSLGSLWPKLCGVKVDALLRIPQIDSVANDTANYLTVLFSSPNYYLLDSSSGHPLPGYPKSIAASFGPKPGHQHSQMPHSLDAAYYDYANNRAVFINRNWAFEYNILGPNATLRTKNCCEKRISLKSKFPLAKGHRPLPVPVSAVYQRSNDTSLYLVSGEDYWIFGAVDNSTVTVDNEVLLRYGGKVFDMWPGLCATASSASGCGRHRSV